ncbi:MAG: putative membrane protein YeiH, partial [Limisphaerales bacterium]
MLHLIEFGAVISFGLFGILLARKNRLDFIGVFTVAFITAFAGGTLRDLFLDRHPLFWIANDHYAVTVFCLALGSILIPAREVPVERWLQLPDALGLGLFAIVGANHALEAGTSLFIASLMGVVTGTAGGAISDVICNEVPRLFKATPLYATCAFAG